LLITDPGAPAVRRTNDVDVIAEIASYVDYMLFSERLRALGFQEDMSDALHYVAGSTRACGYSM
jgi:hypothetical protein